MKTIRQLADELGVSKQRVYRYVRVNCISEAHHDAGVMWFDDAVADRIIAHFSGDNRINDVHHEAHHDAHQNDTVDALIALLKRDHETLKRELEAKTEQLRAKDEQIKALSERLAESNGALVTAQQLHAGTIRYQLTEGSADGRDGEPERPGKLKGMFSGWFRKK